MDVLIQMFPGIGTFLFVPTKIAIARVALMLLGIILAYYGFKGVLEPLIMVPMGFGMIAINAGQLFLQVGVVGTIILDALITDPMELVDIMQVNFMQPIYNLTFSNGLIACLVFMGIGARSDIDFILGQPWVSLFIALLGELGTSITLVLGLMMGLTPGQAAATACIGGADGPMVLFASLMLAPEYFVHIAIISYLYLSLTYAGYPFLIKLMVPEKYRGIDVWVDMPPVSQKAKFTFCMIVCLVLCLVLPVAAPLMLSFWIGLGVKEAQIEGYITLMEETVTYASTFFLALTLGTLCEAATLLDPVVGKLVILGITALFFSGVGGLLAGWIVYYVKKGEYNPVIGIAGVSCVPTTTKLAQHAVSDANPFAIVIPLAMGCNVCGVITSAVFCGVYVATLFLIGG